MPRSDIPSDVRRLITEHIPSVERLEILLLIFAGRKHGWTVAEIERQIRSTTISIRRNLAALIDANLAQPERPESGAVQYRVTSKEMDATVTELALMYRIRRVAIIESIYAERRETKGTTATVKPRAGAATGRSSPRP